MRFVSLVLVLLAWSLPAAPASAREPGFLGFYQISFDRYGRLTSPYEEALAISELRANDQLERVIIIAYGWATDGEASLGEYEELLRYVSEGLPGTPGRRRTAVIGIGWDSSQTGIRKLLNDLIPLPILADAAAAVPDRVLFPLSFWSKAAMADRIGFGGLRGTLNHIFAEAFPKDSRQPEIYLIGHSFGSRILAALIKERIGLLPVQTQPFEALAQVRGALFIQPALVLANLQPGLPFPVVITQSEHDHANGLLFPIGNLVVNAYSFTTFEALFQNRIFRAVESTLETARDTVIDTGGRVLGNGSNSNASDPEPEEVDPDAPETDSPLWSIPRIAYGATRRTSAELLSIPVAALFSFVAAPIQYAYTQYTGLRHHPVDHVMDTLAQLPVAEAFVGLGDRLLGHARPWGRNSKGFFFLGALHESAGRLVPQSLFYGSVPPPTALEALDDSPARRSGCGLPRCRGVVLIDVSDAVGGGLFGDLRNPWIDYTVGWFDLVGTHSAYRDQAVAELVARVLSAPSNSLGTAAPTTLETPTGAAPRSK